jgi:hypothetical protein
MVLSSVTRKLNNMSPNFFEKVAKTIKIMLNLKAIILHTHKLLLKP